MCPQPETRAARRLTAASCQHATLAESIAPEFRPRSKPPLQPRALAIANDSSLCSLQLSPPAKWMTRTPALPRSADRIVRPPGPPFAYRCVALRRRFRATTGGAHSPLVKVVHPTARKSGTSLLRICPIFLSCPALDLQRSIHTLQQSSPNAVYGEVKRIGRFPLSFGQSLNCYFPV